MACPLRAMPDTGCCREVSGFSDLLYGFYMEPCGHRITTLFL